jgi:monofunctional biosynthetic peptidoglycan transglycosylase
VAASLRRQRGGILGALFKALLLVVVAFLLLSCAAVLALRWTSPVTSAYMLEASAHAAFSGNSKYHTDYEWVDLEHISPNAAIAVVASEDQQFPFHAGFDFNSIREAVRASERGKKLRGASTISQQVAKNLFLWNGGFVRKGLEAYFTVLIEAMWPKERILEMYLNIAQFGDGIYGVEAASRRFFHKPAARLTSSEASLLAVVLPNPVKMRADRPSSYVQMRREQNLEQMRALGGASYLKSIENENPPPLAAKHHH